jgi:hypothetical protein
MTDRELLERVRLALRLFVGAAYPVSPQIDPRGHRWSDAYLEQALPVAVDALSAIAAAMAPTGEPTNG